MGVVYLGRRDDLGSLAAIKILRDAWLSPARRERFASEQRMLAQLNHPSIARLYDADTLPDGTPWFVMEYVEGVALTAYCRTHRCTITERLRLFRDVCEAVLHAHQHLVIHRDLKPSNILVAQGGAVKLLDFGISKQLGSGGVPADATRTGLRLMTPAYAAPEQVRGQPVGIHADVYSLGVVLYELLANRLPFDLSNRTPGEAESLILHGEPDKPSVAARSGSADGAGAAADASRAAWGDLDVLVLTAMHKDPQRRYQSAEALIRDIDHFLKGEPLEARPDSLRYRAEKFVRRNWRALTVAAAIFAFVVGLTTFYTLRLATARNQAVAETARTQRIQRFMLSLFEGGDESTGPADTLRVVTLIDEGVRQARALDREPVVQTELFHTLGGIYQQLGQFDRADSLLRVALERSQSRGSGSESDIAQSLVSLGLLRIAQAKLDEGEQLIRQGLDRYRKALPPDDPAVAEATTALGKALEEKGEYDKAIEVLNEAVRIYSARDSVTTELEESMSALANVHFYAGHYAVSDSLNRRVLTMSRRLHGDRHPSVADDLINLGAIQAEQGNYAEAERYYRQGLAIIEPWYGKDHYRTAGSLTMLGRVLMQESKYEEAVALLERSLAIQERVLGKMHPRVAGTLNELGTAARLDGKLDVAESRFRRMLDIYRATYGDKHYLIGIALSNLGSVYLQRKQYAQAESLFRQGLRRVTEAQGPEHTNAAIARIKLGRALVGQHRFAEAEKESLAGYEILSRTVSPTMNFLVAVRGDLIAIYDSLGQPAKAEKFRAEVAALEAKAGGKP
jgi:serine/threonine-protein kinase